ncbi:MAG: alpha/beta hydrolase [Alphaproteobacteria bacterium]|nr:MAG: alpha/beta hydrolase [Alphaproteobacteria bacterium]
MAKGANRGGVGRRSGEGTTTTMQVIVTAFSAYLVLTGAMFLMQRAFLYPGGGGEPDIASAGVAGLREVVTTTADGLRLVHWYRPPPAPDAPVVVVFHGNAGHLGDRVPKLASLLEAGFGMMFVGYRGFGSNPGRPTEDDLSADARLVLDWLGDQGIPAERLVLYGESLGTGVAVKMAAERPVAAVVLEAPYTSIADVAQSHYWFLPARWLLLDKWNSLGRIVAIDTPLLVLHGARDRTVPLRFGERLFATAREPKEMLVIPEAAHTDLFDFPEVRERVIAFVRRYAGRGQDRRR